MEQLLKITTVPVAFEIKIENARLEYTPGKAELEISQNDSGEFKIKSRPIRLNMDKFELSSSSGSNGKSTNHLVQALSNGSTHSSYSATGQYEKDGSLFINSMLTPSTSMPVSPSGSQTASHSSANDSAHSEFTMRYEMDKMNFDLKSTNGNFEFIPGDIEMVITQRPELKIEYIGKPIYVPPSAAERFEATV